MKIIYDSFTLAGTRLELKKRIEISTEANGILGGVNIVTNKRNEIMDYN